MSQPSSLRSGELQGLAGGLPYAQVKGKAVMEDNKKEKDPSLEPFPLPTEMGKAQEDEA